MRERHAMLRAEVGQLLYDVTIGEDGTGNVMFRQRNQLCIGQHASVLVRLIIIIAVERLSRGCVGKL